MRNDTQENKGLLVRIWEYLNQAGRCPCEILAERRRLAQADVEADDSDREAERNTPDEQRIALSDRNASSGR